MTAQSYCSADPEGMRDLQQQYARFLSEISDGRSKGRAPTCSEGDQTHFKIIYGFTDVKYNLLHSAGDFSR